MLLPRLFHEPAVFVRSEARRLAIAAVFAALGISGCGGGAGTTENPVTGVTPPSTYSGPPPATEDVQLQIRQVGSSEVLCTILPPGSFTQKGRVFKFKNPDDALPSAQNLRMVMVKLAKNGTVRFKARGKQTRFAMPTLDTLRITVGFRDPSGENAPRCSTNAAAFRTTKKGALVYP